MMASMSLPAYEHLKPRLIGLYALEERVGFASRSVVTDRDDAIAKLSNCAGGAGQMRDELPALLHAVMKRAGDGLADAT